MSSQQFSATCDSRQGQHHEQILSSIHWRAPATIIISFLAAFVFAASHHVLYSFLGRTAVSNTIIKQQAIVAAGTAFAFLFRTSLMISLATTYHQLFWWSIRRRPLTFSMLDSLGALMNSMFEMLNYRAVVFSPALAAVAVLIWVISIASVFPPATLSVGGALVTSISPHFPSTIDYEGETLPKHSNGLVMNEINSHTWWKSGFSWYGKPSGQLLKT